MKPLEIAESAVCGALYAVTGYIIYLFLPIVTPGIGIVRFWPNVVVPAVFSVLFGPLVGGLGAAIGIFISDMLIHGDPLLSLSAGVTANFLGFYLLGYISRKKIDWTKLIAVSGVGCLIISFGSLATISYVTIPQIVNNRLIDQENFTKLMEGANPIINGLNLFTAIMVAAFIIAVAIGYLWPEWREYELGSVIGLIVGSTIIGLIVWAYSQIFVLPAAVGGGGSPLPFYAALLWLIWTFATEIPFLILLGPPILKACQRAFPSLIIQKTESK
ncbi:MAG: hypothetical protein QXH40_00415 [Candidatus Bathyarchaeia archaeon]